MFDYTVQLQAQSGTVAFGSGGGTSFVGTLDAAIDKLLSVQYMGGAAANDTLTVTVTRPDGDSQTLSLPVAVTTAPLIVSSVMIAAVEGTNVSFPVNFTGCGAVLASDLRPCAG
jgi:hypothetical protein